MKKITTPAALAAEARRLATQGLSQCAIARVVAITNDSACSAIRRLCGDQIDERQRRIGLSALQPEIRVYCKKHSLGLSARNQPLVPAVPAAGCVLIVIDVAAEVRLAKIDDASVNLSDGDSDNEIVRPNTIGFTHWSTIVLDLNRAVTIDRASDVSTKRLIHRRHYTLQQGPKHPCEIEDVRL